MKTVSVLAAKRLGIAHCHAHNTLQQVCSQVTEEDISSLVVVDESGYLQGIITRTDILRAALSHEENWRDLPVGDWMTRNVITVAPDTLLQTAAEHLLEHGIHRVVVVQDEDGAKRPLAVVSDSDIVYHLHRRGA